MTAFILSHFDKITIVVFVIFGVFAIGILRRNKELDISNQELKQVVSGAKQMLTIQSKVFDAIQNTENTDLNGTLDRLRKDKL